MVQNFLSNSQGLSMIWMSNPQGIPATHLLGKNINRCISPLCGKPVLGNILSPETDNYLSCKYSRLALTRIPRDSLKYFQDIRTSTYQIYRREEKIIRTTTFSKFICNWTPEFRDISKILWKRGEIAPEDNFSSFPQYFYTCFKIFMFSQGQDFHFEISGNSRLDKVPSGAHIPPTSATATF